VKTETGSFESGAWCDLHQRLLDLLLVTETHRQEVAVAAPAAGALVELTGRDLAGDVLDFAEIGAQAGSLAPADVRTRRSAREHQVGNGTKGEDVACRRRLLRILDQLGSAIEIGTVRGPYDR
jgi:hypothetical protein